VLGLLVNGEQMVKLPESVVILSHEYRVVRVPPGSLDNDHGTVNYELQEIQLSDSIDGSFLCETLLHEILHIIDYYTSGPEQLSESDIFRMSTVLYDTFRNNPELVRRLFISK
jgi:hypothetical protein